MSINSLPDHASRSTEPLVIEAPGFPPPRHPAEADVFARHEGLRGHDQEALRKATVLIAGCGGLGSWTALALARMGVGHLILCDPDSYDRTNASRQLMFCADVGVNKAIALSRNLLSHCTASTRITALPSPFEARLNASVDLIMALTDNNASRIIGSDCGLAQGLPVLFAMLANDGRPTVRLFAQLPGGACLRCAFPDIDPEAAAACVPASIGPCLLAAAILSIWTRQVLAGACNTNWFVVDDLHAIPGHFVLQRPSCRCAVTVSAGRITMM